MTLRRIATAGVAAVSLAMLVGCSGGPVDRRTQGQILGGATGAAIGSLFGAGTGRIAATGAGAVIGSIAGGRIAEN
ncbi:MAG TPA: glycine zipper 2TM domain-containing protein [Paracoccaceae bacterium]|nr:glycine zipper 2TM domain-containing protein [Paracoccaceae bacterium]